MTRERALAQVVVEAREYSPAPPVPVSPRIHALLLAAMFGVGTSRPPRARYIETGSRPKLTGREKQRAIRERAYRRHR